jgi:hypothetical protein
MDAAEQAAAMAKELTRLNTSAKEFRSQFVSTSNVLLQALPLYADVATASRRCMIDSSLEKIGLQADKVHDAYQRLIKFDEDERHHKKFYERQQRTSTDHKNIIAHSDKVLGEEDGPLQRQQYHLRAEDMEQQDDFLLGSAAHGNQGGGGPLGKFI